MTANSWNFASKKFALIGNFSDTIDWGDKRAYVAVRLLPILFSLNMGDFQQQLDIFCRQLVVCGRKHAYVDLEL